MIQGGHCPSQHRRINLPTPNGRQQINIAGEGGYGRSKGPGVLAHLIRRGAKDIAKSPTLSIEENVGSILPVAFQARIRVAHEFKITIANGGKPGDFGAL